jgi:hypothetical protein
MGTNVFAGRRDRNRRRTDGPENFYRRAAQMNADVVQLKPVSRLYEWENAGMAG